MVDRCGRWSGVRRGGFVAVVALAAMVLGSRVAAAAGATDRVLTGGFSSGTTSPAWTSPGLSNVYGNDFPETGAGESSAQMRMPEGILRRLRVSLKDRNQTSGTVTVMVRLNGADTALTCTVNVVGICGTPAGVEVAMNAGDLLAIRVDNNLTNEDGVLLTYTIQFD